jgi:hypothetical protein
LSEAELKRIFEHRINCRNERLNGVIEKMRETGCQQNQQNGSTFCWCCRCFVQILGCFRGHWISEAGWHRDENETVAFFDPLSALLIGFVSCNHKLVGSSHHGQSDQVGHVVIQPRMISNE